jgi:outer membrane lipoprotein-sorting protein
MFWLFALFLTTSLASGQSDDLLTRIWTGEQQAQAKFTTACGTVTEVRTSRLMVKPLILHGKFCAEGTNRFMLEYFEPNPMRIRLKKDYNITTQENNLDFEMKLIPRSEYLRHRFNYLVVKLNKKDFLPRSLEVDGKSGVNSVFTFDITSVNIKLPEETFEVLKTK